MKKKHVWVGLLLWLCLCVPVGIAAEGTLFCFKPEVASELSDRDAQNMDDLLCDYAALRATAYTGERTLMGSDRRFHTMAQEENSRKTTIANKMMAMDTDVWSADSTMDVLKAGYTTDGLIEMTVYEWTLFEYDDTSDEKFALDTTGIGTYHKIFVDPLTNEIVADAYDEGPFTGVTSADYYNLIGDPIWVQESKWTEEQLKETGRDEQDDRRLMYTFYTAYNPDACVDYSDRYVYHGAAGGGNYEGYYNSAYTNFNPYGGDCANYTSQSIYAGGMPQVVGSDYGSNGWFYVTASHRSATWTGAPYLRNWMAANRGKVVNNPASSQVFKGSPCFYDWGNGGASYDHATICVGVNSAGWAIINSHNYDYYHAKYNYGGYVSTVQLTPTNSTLAFQSRIEVPVASNTYSGLTLQVGGWAIGPKPMQTVVCSMDGGEAVELTLSSRQDVSNAFPNYPSENNSFGGYISIVGLANGSHTITLTATDTEGNTFNVGSVTFTIEKNTELTLSSFENGDMITGDTLSIVGTIKEENQEVINATADVEGVPATLTLTGKSISGSADISTLQAGTHSLTVTVTLADGTKIPFVFRFVTTDQKPQFFPTAQKMLLSGYTKSGDNAFIKALINTYNIPLPKVGNGYYDLTTNQHTAFMTTQTDFSIPHTISFRLADVSMDNNYTSGIYAGVWAQQDDFAAYAEGLWIEFSPTGVGARINKNSGGSPDTGYFNSAQGHTGDLFAADFASEEGAYVNIINRGTEVLVKVNGENAMLLRSSDGTAIKEGSVIDVYAYENGQLVKKTSYTQPELTATSRHASFYSCGEHTTGKLYDYTISEGENDKALTLGNGISVVTDKNVITAYFGSGSRTENMRIEKPYYVREMLLDGVPVDNLLFTPDNATHSLTIDGVRYQLVFKDIQEQASPFVCNEGFTLYGNTTTMPAGWKVLSGTFAAKSGYLYASATAGKGHPCLYTTVVASAPHAFTADIQNVANTSGNGSNAAFLGLRCYDNTNWPSTHRGIWIKMNYDSFWIFSKDGYRSGFSQATVSGVDFNARFHTVRAIDDGSTVLFSVQTKDGAWVNVYRFTGLASGGTSISYQNLITGETGTITTEAAGIAAKGKGYYAIWHHDDADDLVSELRCKNVSIDTEYGEHLYQAPQVYSLDLLDPVSGYSVAESVTVGDLIYVNTDGYKGMYTPVEIVLKSGYTLEETIVGASFDVAANTSFYTDETGTYLLAQNSAGSNASLFKLTIIEQPAEQEPLRSSVNKLSVNDYFNTLDINVTYKNQQENASSNKIYTAFYDEYGRMLDLNTQSVALSQDEAENVSAMIPIPQNASNYTLLSLLDNTMLPAMSAINGSI